MGNNKKRKPHKKKALQAPSQSQQEEVAELVEKSENVCATEKEKSPISNESMQENIEKQIKPIEIEQPVEQKCEEKIKVPNEEEVEEEGGKDQVKIKALPA